VDNVTNVSIRQHNNRQSNSIGGDSGCLPGGVRQVM
jgi:hypothetical protein